MKINLVSSSYHTATILGSDVVLLLTSSVLPLVAGVQLTLQNVTTAVNNLEWISLCKCLCVPESKRRHIEQQASEHHKRMLVEWWLLTDPAPSWRRLICCFDYYGSPGLSMYDPSCAATADLIRHNAEPVQGMLSTFMSLPVIKLHTCQLLVATCIH